MLSFKPPQKVCPYAHGVGLGLAHCQPVYTATALHARRGALQSPGDLGVLNKGIHLDLDTWVGKQANLRRGLGNSYKPAGTEVLISAVAHNTPPPGGAECHNCVVYLHMW